MITIYHLGQSGCNKPAMYLLKELHLGELVAAHNLRHLDGRSFIVGELTRFDNCLESISWDDFTFSLMESMAIAKGEPV